MICAIYIYIYTYICLLRCCAHEGRSLTQPSFAFFHFVLLFFSTSVSSLTVALFPLRKQVERIERAITAFASARVMHHKIVHRLPARQTPLRWIAAAHQHHHREWNRATPAALHPMLLQPSRPFSMTVQRHCSAASSTATSARVDGGEEIGAVLQAHRVTSPGHSEEDAFGQSDALQAVGGALHTSPAATLAEEVDVAVGAQNRRRNRRKRTADAILGDVLHDALRLRDMGHKPTADFVYKRTQERMYEEEYGRKPPSSKENAAKYIPFPPDFHLHRLLPLYGGDSAAATACPKPSGGEDQPQASNSPTYTKNSMHTHVLMEDDPWPERSICPQNPVWTRQRVEQDKQRTNGKDFKAWEELMYNPREGCDLTGEFIDAMDELAHWHVRFLSFLRDVPLSQRRSLPFLHEWHRLLVHRVIRAERRYMRVRDVALAKLKAAPSLHTRTELAVEEVRAIYAEAHRSLASPNYDPLRMKKSALAPFMRMSRDEFAEWREVQRQRRNSIVADFS